jgi:colanic acid/amylovoran biosynthesis protein
MELTALSEPADTSSNSRPLQIGLLWHSLFNENLGVGALTLANANLVAKAAERAGYRPVLHVIGSRGGFDYRHELGYEHTFTNIGISAMANPFSDLHRIFRRCDIVFDIGGGDSFSDIYSGSRYWMIILTKLAAVQAGARVILSPQTIGPFHTPLSRRAAIVALNRADHVFARDELSFRVLQELGVKAGVSLTTDVAFALPYRKSDRTSEDGAQDRPLKLGLNVSALLYRAHRSPHTNIKLAVDYVALVDALMERLTANPGIELHLVGHVIAQKDATNPVEGHIDDDYSMARELKARFPSAIVAPKFSSPIEAKTYIAGLDAFSGSRMHATIAAISSDTPVIPLGYSRKFNGLFESIGYNYNIDLTRETNEAVLARFDAALADLPAMRDQAKAANAEARRRLGVYEAYLDQVIGQLAPRHV